MTEASKKRMEEKKQQDMFTFKHGVWPETISEQVRLRDADFACLGFKAGFEAGYKAGMQDPDANDEEFQKLCQFIGKEFGDLSGCYDASDVISMAKVEIQERKELLEEVEFKVRVHLFTCILVNIEEVGLEETIDWMRSRLNFERDKLRAVKGEK